MPGNKEIKHAILNLGEFKMQLEMKDQIEATMRHQSRAEDSELHDSKCAPLSQHIGVHTALAHSTY